MVTINAKILKALNFETELTQIGLAVSFSLIAGLTPTVSLQNLIVPFVDLCEKKTADITLHSTRLSHCYPCKQAHNPPAEPFRLHLFGREDASA